jgi:hypothetical protein
MDAYRVSEARENKNMHDICTATGRQLNARKLCKRDRPAAVVESKYQLPTQKRGQRSRRHYLCRPRETSPRRCPAHETNRQELARLGDVLLPYNVARWLPLVPTTLMNSARPRSL